MAKQTKRVMPSDTESDDDIAVPPTPKSFVSSNPPSLTFSSPVPKYLFASQSTSHEPNPCPSESQSNIQTHSKRPSTLPNDSNGQLNRIENLLGRVLRQLEDVKETQRLQMAMIRSLEQQPL